MCTLPWPVRPHPPIPLVVDVNKAGKACSPLHMAEDQANDKPRDIEFYGGASRFELELEFVQSLSNPLYIQHLAAQKYLEDDDFVRYLDYLQYFCEPQYMKFLQCERLQSRPTRLKPDTDRNRRYPGPTLRALELLQQAQFRKDAISPALVDQMVTSGFEAATAGLGK